MPRARLIKPQFFLDEAVADLPDTAQLLFIGLWTIADRAGRLEDKPRVIKAQIFPYRTVDIVEMLASLADANLIERYQVGSRKIIQIRSFTRHQHCHINEPKSLLPAPGKSTVQARCKNNSRTVQAPDKNRFNPSEAEAEAVTEAEAERERPPRTRRNSLSDSVHFVTEEHLKALEENPNYADKDIRASFEAAKRYYPDGVPIDRFLKWLAREQRTKNDDRGSADQAARVAANFSRDN